MISRPPALLFLPLALTLCACGGDLLDANPSPEDPSPTPTLAPAQVEGLSLQSVTYVLDWDWGDADISESGDGWTLTNDLGLRITLSEGYLVSNSLALIPCESALAIKASPENHYVDSDPSTLLVPYVEDLMTPGTVTLDAIEFEAQTYCQAYYLAARIVDVGDNIPEGLDMTAISLTLSGSISDGSGADPTPFTLTTSFANSAILALDVVEEAGPFNATLTLTRSLGTLFQGLDPRELGEDELAWEIMKNLMEGTTVEVSLE